MSDLTYAWHFVGATLRDGRPIPPDGEWLVHTGDVVMCESGLHASERLIDALQYTPGSTICRVACEGIVASEHDKLVCRRRKIEWRVAGDHLLGDFARRCAWNVLHLWEPPQIVVDYLRSGDVSRRAAAWDTARTAAWHATRSTARDAALAAALARRAAAARDTARDAAWHAAWAAAWHATRSTARDAAWHMAWARRAAAARDEQNEWLTEMVEQAHAGTYAQWTASNRPHVTVRKGGE